MVPFLNIIVGLLTVLFLVAQMYGMNSGSSTPHATGSDGDDQGRGLIVARQLNRSRSCSDMTLHPQVHEQYRLMCHEEPNPQAHNRSLLRTLQGLNKKNEVLTGDVMQAREHARAFSEAKRNAEEQLVIIKGQWYLHMLSVGVAAFAVGATAAMDWFSNQEAGCK